VGDLKCNSKRKKNCRFKVAYIGMRIEVLFVQQGLNQLTHLS